MFRLEIIDTFPRFLVFWSEAQQKGTDSQIDSWASEYMSPWPELLDKQLQDYSIQRVDWRQTAKEKVFPFLSERLPVMEEAHANLLRLSPVVYRKARAALGFESDMTLVIYVGIGCGAGWTTSFRNGPAILFGLENIAECGWSDVNAISGLIAHEIGHIAHRMWRTEGGMTDGSGPWWQLYSEGFAQTCEHTILREEKWHVADARDPKGWLDYCREKRGWLAGEFLRKVERGESLQPFFGSWFHVHGRRHTGHFLGHELVKELQQNMSLKQVASLGDVECTCRAVLEKYCKRGA